MTDRVLIERHGAVAHVQLNRADKRNALDVAMFEGIVAAGEQLRTDRSVRAVVLSGVGQAFSAGLDFSAFSAFASGGGSSLLARDAAVSPANLAQRVGWIWQELEVPVIAALHGVAFGGGFQIAAGADIRVAHPQTQLSIMEIKWGLIPDMSITATTLRYAALDAVKELMVASGVSPMRIDTVSYGEERPLDTHSNKAAWSKNRRAEFVITWSDGEDLSGSTASLD